MQFSPKNSPLPTKAIVASFPFAEVTVTLSRPRLHVKNCVGRVALRVGHLIFFKMREFSCPTQTLARKPSGSKTVSPFFGCGLGV